MIRSFVAALLTFGPLAMAAPSNYEAGAVKPTLLREAANPIQECFRAWERKHPTFENGRVHVDWQILPGGRVKGARIVHSELKGMEPCVLESVKRVTFPLPPDKAPYYVAHRFYFKNEKFVGPSP